MTSRDGGLRGGNRLLAPLPDADADQLRPHLESVRLALRQVLCQPDEAISHVYFPLTTMVSLLTPAGDGTSVETAMVGREGMIGLPVFLGVDISRAVAVCQVPGEALRIAAPAFRDQLHWGNALSQRLQRYTCGRLVQTAQTVACNHRHSVIQRCAYWLLAARDGVDADAFPLTQAFLATILGVRRATVAVAAGKLQRAGLIRYHLGRVTITDGAGLQAAACSCYRVISDEFDRLLG